MAHAQPNSSDARAFEILAIEQTLPWIRFSPQSPQTLKDFFKTWPPSSTSQSDVAWICVGNSRLQPGDSGKDSTDTAGLQKAWDDICTNHQPTITDLDELARRCDILVGKWLVFARSANVDSLWSRIATATHMGTLGISAKVSPRSNSDSHVICVFTRDYTDVGSVNKVRDGLRRLGIKGVIGYKPNIYTHCRVYRNNPWGISPTRYHQ